MSRNSVSPHWRVAQGVPGALEPPARVLVHQSRFHVGDALWLTPLLRNVRRAFPSAEVTVAAGPRAAPVLSRSPHVSQLIVWDPAGGEPERERVLVEMRKRRIDAALFALVRRDKSRWLAEAIAAAGVPWRVNLEYLENVENGEIPAPDGLFTHEAWFVWGLLPSPKLLLHALSPWLGTDPGQSGDWLEDRRVEMPVTAEERAAAGRVLEEAGIGDGPFAVLAPAGQSSDRWPPERFAELGLRLIERLGCPLLIEGAPADEPLLRAVERGIGRPDRARAATDPLGVFTALLERARLLVSNDSAPIHLAEAAGTPTLYFAHREKLVHSHPAGPVCRALWDDGADRPAEIPVERAWEAVLRLWSR